MRPRSSVSSVKPHLDALLARNLGLVVWIAAVAVLADPVTATAQSGCSVSGLSRRGSEVRRLAVEIGDDWKFFSENPEGPAHSLTIDRQSVTSLCLAWEAPPHRALSRQFVYISTRYTTDQPLSLFRSGGFPVLTADDWGDGRSRGQADALAGDFREYHRKRSSSQETLFDDLNRWHDGNTSYGLVSGALGNSTRLPNGGERLLTLLPLRPFKSWVRFSSHVPAAGDTLRVAVAYSGDVESLGARAYEYIFEFE